MPVIAACLGLELVAQVADPAEGEAEGKRRDRGPVCAQVVADPFEERTSPYAASSPSGHNDATGTHVGCDGSRERPGRVAHERESPGIAVSQAAVEPEGVA